MWDGADGEPEIYHGHTLTSRIMARDVLDAIATWAFKASPFPLILSLENHLSAAQQCVMATLLRECLARCLGFAQRSATARCGATFSPSKS